MTAGSIPNALADVHRRAVDDADANTPQFPITGNIARVRGPCQREAPAAWSRRVQADGYVRSVGGSPVILSRFSDRDADNERYLLVVNRSYARTAQTRLTLSDSVSKTYRLNTFSGEFEQVTPTRNLRLQIGRGRAQLYRLQTA